MHFLFYEWIKPKFLCSFNPRNPHKVLSVIFTNISSLCLKWGGKSPIKPLGLGGPHSTIIPLRKTLSSHQLQVSSLPAVLYPNGGVELRSGNYLILSIFFKAVQKWNKQLLILEFGISWPPIVWSLSLKKTYQSPNLIVLYKAQGRKRINIYRLPSLCQLLFQLLHKYFLINCSQLCEATLTVDRIHIKLTCVFIVILDKIIKIYRRNVKLRNSKWRKDVLYIWLSVYFETSLNFSLSYK